MDGRMHKRLKLIRLQSQGYSRKLLSSKMRRGDGEGEWDVQWKHGDSAASMSISAAARRSRPAIDIAGACGGCRCRPGGSINPDAVHVVSQASPPYSAIGTADNSGTKPLSAPVDLVSCPLPRNSVGGAALHHCDCGDWALAGNLAAIILARSGGETHRSHLRPRRRRLQSAESRLHTSVRFAC